MESKIVDLVKVESRVVVIRSWGDRRKRNGDRFINGY
jgi:hypothetical protein